MGVGGGEREVRIPPGVATIDSYTFHFVIAHGVVTPSKSLTREKEGGQRRGRL